jgi:hypothetical protein
MVMVDPAIKQQILEDLEKMTPEQQRRAAESVHAQLSLVPESSEADERARRREELIAAGVLQPAKVKSSAERARILKEVTDRMRANPIPKGAPRRFTRDELHARR